MVKLDVTVPFLGRFEVNDDYSISDVSLLPMTTDDEVATLVETMRNGPKLGVTYLEVLTIALASLYSADPQYFTVHSEDSVPTLVDETIQPTT